MQLISGVIRIPHAGGSVLFKFCNCKMCVIWMGITRVWRGISWNFRIWSLKWLLPMQVRASVPGGAPLRNEELMVLRVLPVEGLKQIMNKGAYSHLRMWPKYLISEILIEGGTKEGKSGISDQY